MAQCAAGLAGSRGRDLPERLLKAGSGRSFSPIHKTLSKSYTYKPRLCNRYKHIVYEMRASNSDEKPLLMNANVVNLTTFCYLMPCKQSATMFTWRRNQCLCYERVNRHVET